jgi:hypothetical protein
MSSYIQQASNVAADAAQNTAYGAERAKQETNNASGTTSATTNAYVDQAKNVVASVANTAQQYAASAGVGAPLVLSDLVYSPILLANAQ